MSAVKSALADAVSRDEHNTPSMAAVLYDYAASKGRSPGIVDDLQARLRRLFTDENNAFEVREENLELASKPNNSRGGEGAKES